MSPLPLSAVDLLACWLAQWLESVLGDGRQIRADLPTVKQPSRVANGGEVSQRLLAMHPIGVLSGTAAALAAIIGIEFYPVGTALLVIVLAAYLYVLVRRPWSWLFALPAALPYPH